MITGFAITEYFRFFKEVLEPYDVIPSFIFDPSLTFDPALRRLVSKMTEEEFLPSGNNWLGVLWSRSPINVHPSLGRVVRPIEKDYNLASGDEFRGRMSFIELTMLIVSTSLSRLETVEEVLLCREQNVELSFQVEFDAERVVAQNVTLPVTVTDFVVNSIDKYPVLNQGSLANLTVTMNLTYPVLMPTRVVPLILYPTANIYSGEYTEGEENTQLGTVSVEP